jgi:hypothetical protein
MLSLSVIGAVSTGRRASGASSLFWNLLIAVVTVIVSVAAHIESPVVMIVVIASSCLSQLAVSLPRRAADAVIPSHSVIQQENGAVVTYKH